MTKQKKLKEIIFSEFDKSIEGTDIYDHLGSKWIIFTNERRWVLEFTNDRTLWFNYRHFDDILALFAMDSDQYSDYIKEWYERRFIFKTKVENTIQNGVEHCEYGDYEDGDERIEKICQNRNKSYDLSIY